MCGIAGGFAFAPRMPLPEVDRVRSLCNAMKRRGPDDEGLWVSPDGRACLGHRRLAIVGLGQQGHQPMVLERRCRGGTVAALSVSFNGEIYNYRSLRASLLARGHEFRTNCDTEVLLHLYEDFGAKFAQELRGMFAVALWDDRSRELVLARDPYGIKPLYYSASRDGFWFASQVRPLVDVGLGEGTSTAAAAGFCLFGHIPEPLTTHDGVFALPAGSTLRVTKDGPYAPTPYHSLPAALVTAEEAVDPRQPDEVSEALAESVQAHLLADVDVGVFLSAGLDSATILALASEVQQQLKSVTLAFEEYAGTPADERPLAELTAEHYGAEHSSSIITKSSFTGAAEQILDDMDQPTIDGVNTWFVSRAASERGLKVVLSGLGGDELFAGYDSFQSVPRWYRRTRFPAQVPGLGVIARVASTRALRARSPKASGLLEYGDSVERAWFARRALFMPWELPQVLGADVAHDGLARLGLEQLLSTAITPRPRSIRGVIAALEGGLYMRNQLLRDTDWASMAHSLEVRVPFADRVLLQAVAPAVLQRTDATTKRDMLARAPRRPLPDSVLARRKTGFGVPVGEWLLDASSSGSWRRSAMLSRVGAPWARRWSYVVGERFGLIAA